MQLRETKGSLNPRVRAQGERRASLGQESRGKHLCVFRDLKGQRHNPGGGLLRKVPRRPLDFPKVDPCSEYKQEVRVWQIFSKCYLSVEGVYHHTANAQRLTEEFLVCFGLILAPDSQGNGCQNTSKGTAT